MPKNWEDNAISIDQYSARKWFYWKCQARNEWSQAVLRSYETIVAIFDRATGEYKEKYFSKTTNRHQRAFRIALWLE